MVGGKKRKNVPTLQDLLDRPICYYCEKDFENLNYLIDHMKAKHYKCERCGRRLTTAGGLGVHMSQVHKEKLEKVENALPDREKPDIEIFGMEGFPEKLLNAHRTRVTNEYFKREQQLRKDTGNPPKGTAPAAPNPQKTETKEEMKARLAEFKAKRAAEKAAAAGNGGSGSGTNTPPVNNDASVSGAPQNASPQIKTESGAIPPPGTITYDASGRGTLEIGSVDHSITRGYDIAPYQPTPAAYDQKPMMPTHSMHPPSSMPVPSVYPPSYMSMSSRGPNPAAGGQYPPMPPIGMSGSPPPSAFSHGSPPPVVPSAVPRQNSLPSAPGLPQRPAFDSPNISKEDMAKMHIGSGNSPSGPPGPPMHYNALPGSYGSGPPPLGPPPSYGMPNAPKPGYPSQGAPGVPSGMSNSPQGMTTPAWWLDTKGETPVKGAVPTRDDIDDLIASVTMQNTEGIKNKNQYTGVESESSDRTSRAVLTNEPSTVQTQPIHQRDPGSEQRSKESAPSSTQHQPSAHSATQPQQAHQESSVEAPLQTSAMRQPETSSGATLAQPSATTKSTANSTGVSTPTSGHGKGRSGQKKQTKSSAETSKTRLIWNDTTLSPEEKRARTFTTTQSRRTQTVVDQPGEDGQEVTGPIDDSLES